MTVQPQPVEGVFARAWELLTRNWILIVPGIVIGVIVGVVDWALAAPGRGYDPTQLGSVFALAWSRLAIAAITLVGYIATQAFTTGMAGAAWMRGTATLADGSASFQDDAGRIVTTGIGLIGLAIVALILLLPTLGLSLLAFYLFTLYAMPAAIVGNRPGFSSIAESFAIARARFVPTLIIAAMIFLISIVVGLVAGVFSFVPLIGPLIRAVVTQAVIAYATLVVVGEYLAVSGTSSPTATAGSFERRL